MVLIPNTTANCAITYFNILHVCDRTYTLLCLTSGSYCSIFNLAFAGVCVCVCVCVCVGRGGGGVMNTLTNMASILLPWMRKWEMVLCEYEAIQCH